MRSHIASPAGTLSSRTAGRRLAAVSFAGPLLVLALMVGLAGLAVYGASLFGKWQDNRTIARLLANQDVEVGIEASSEVLFARAYYLLRFERFDEVYPLLDVVARRGDDEIRAPLLYDLGNARLRRAYEHLERHEIVPAVPQVNLAKDDYRAALTLRPDNWDFKHNLDVAMQLVRDFPSAEQFGEMDELEQPDDLWSDMPGVPSGLP